MSSGSFEHTRHATPVVSRESTSIRSQSIERSGLSRSRQEQAPVLPFAPRINGLEQARHVRSIIGNVAKSDPESGLRRLAEHAGKETMRSTPPGKQFGTQKEPSDTRNPFFMPDREKLQHGMIKDMQKEQGPRREQQTDEVALLQEQLERSQQRHHELALGIIEGVTGMRGKREKKDDAEDPSFLSLIMYLIVLFMQTVAQEDKKTHKPGTNPHVILYARRDLNPQPSDPESDALSN